jgi:hypothetical protein
MENNKRVETIILAAGQPFPDIKKWNQEAPPEEQSENFGKGPWQAQRLVYLLNLDTMDRFTFATPSTGGAIAVRDLVDRAVWMRKLKGDNVYPVVTMAKKLFHTGHGDRDRPHFTIRRWVTLGDEQKSVADQSEPQASESEVPYDFGTEDPRPKKTAQR